jgi:hypothetical protein
MLVMGVPQWLAAAEVPGSSPGAHFLFPCVACLDPPSAEAGVGCSAGLELELESELELERVCIHSKQVVKLTTFLESN